jgi:sulfite exporter TauE/SafE
MLYSALIFGFLGSFHCVGMCGPIAFLLPVDRKNPAKRVLQLISYHLGRIFTYSILGLVFGIVGKRHDAIRCKTDAETKIFRKRRLPY